MRMFFNYFLLEAKRSLMVLKNSIFSMISMVMVLCTIVAGLYYFMMETTVFPKIEVGVVLSEEDTVLEMMTNYISSMDSVESICNFHYF